MARGIKTEGFTELVNDLATMAQALSDDQGATQFRKTATGILNDAAEPTLAAMVRMAPVREGPKGGTLRRALKKGKVLTRKGGGGYTIKIGSQKGDDAYYAGWVEFGHGGPHGPAAPHPFMRPAYDATKEQAYGIIRERLNEEINKIGG
jgi:HK97 gp10 family phage protein